MADVFNPLFTTKGANEGVGLGLPQCHATVAALAGDVNLRSEVGSFTEVTIRLPKAAPLKPHEVAPGACESVRPAYVGIGCSDRW